MKNLLKSVVLGGCLSFCAPAIAVAQLESLTVGMVADQIAESAEDIIDLGFDRLDQSLVNAGLQLDSAAAAIRAEYEGSLDATLKTLNQAQKQALQDSFDLLDEIDRNIENNTTQISDSVLKVTSPLYGLLGKKPRLVEISIKNNGWDFSSVELTGKGVAVTDAKSHKLFIGGKQVNLTPVSKNDTKLVYRIPESNWSHALADTNEISRIPVKLVVSYCDGWFIFCKERQNQYYTEIIRFPQKIGSVKAHFTHVKPEVTTSKKCSQNFVSGRVQTKYKFPAKFKRGQTTHYPHVTPDEGFSFITDLNSAKKPTFTFKRLHGGCHGSSSTAGWHVVKPKLLQTKSTASSERKAGATCKVSTIVCGFQTKTENIRVTAEMEAVDLKFGQTTIIDVPGDQVNLTHVEVFSDLFKSGSKIIRLNDSNAIHVEYRPADKRVFVKVKN